MGNKLHPASTDKVVLAYMSAKSQAIKREKITIPTIIKDFFALSNKLKFNLYDITSENDDLTPALENDDLTPALENDLEFLRIHGFIKANYSESYVQLTPLGQYLASWFAIPEEVESIVKNAKERIMSW